ncbi:MAG: glycosyltransferase [Bacillota bacterium]
MDIAIIINPNHFRYGWYNLSLYLKSLISNHNVEILNIPYTSFYSSSYYFYSYKNVDLKKKYDLIIVCEGKPSFKWTKYSNNIIWIVMQEFISGSLWQFIKNQNWCKIWSPSIDLYNRIKQYNNNIFHLPIWTFVSDFKCQKREKSTILLHLKSRNLGEQFYRNFLNNISYSKFDLSLKIDDNSNININHLNIKNIKEINCGRTESQQQFWKQLSSTDIYLSPRVIEGIGLCSQESLFLNNLLVFPDSSTMNEYFDSSNGFKMDTRKEVRSKQLAGKNESTIISKNAYSQAVKYLNDISISELRDIQEKNRNYANDKYLLFRDKYDILINSYSKKIRNKPKILHLQTCLEGGQGLMSVNTCYQLNKRNICKNYFAYISSPEDEETDRLKKRITGISFKKASNPEDLKDLDYDIIFFHWSSVSDKRIENYSIWEDFIKNNKKPTVGFIHDSVIPINPICDYYCVASRFNLRFIPRDSKGTFIIPCMVEDIFYYTKPNVNLKFSPIVFNHVSRLISRKINKKFIPMLSYIKKYFPNISLNILGQGPYKKQLEDDCKKWDIPYKIQHNYSESRADIMAVGDVCLYLTSEHKESFGLSVAEHLALGIPVICENKGALEEVVGQGGTVCNSYHDIIEETYKILSDYNYRLEIKKKAKKQSLKFKPSVVCRQYEKMISSILSSSLIKNSDIKWSIIMPTHNASNYIKTSIKSVIDQTSDNWELIVVDDNSSDNTEEIVNSFNNPNIKYIKNGSNIRGQMYCWKLGSEYCSGKYIAFLDSDDWLYPDALESMSNFYEKNKNICFAWSQNERWDSNLNKKIKTGFSENHMKYGSLIDGLLQNKVIISHLITCKTDKFKEIIFDKYFTTTADKWLALKMDLIGEIRFLDKCLHRYRFLRPGCTTLNKRVEQIKNTEDIINQALKERKRNEYIKCIISDNNFDFEISLNH